MEFDSSDDEVLQIDDFNAEISSVRDMLAKLSIKHRVTKAATTDLLSILKSNYDASLPSDARTLLKTEVSNIKIQLRDLPPGKYYHFGISYEIHNNNVFNDSATIYLVIGIDGLTLTKSSKSTFWPILCYISPSSDKVFPVGL